LWLPRHHIQKSHICKPGNDCSVTGCLKSHLQHRTGTIPSNNARYFRFGWERVVYNTRIDSSTINYSSAAVSRIGIDVPQQGMTYACGFEVRAVYMCQDPQNGSGIAQCNGTVADFALINTSQPGMFSFTVTARDVAGNQSTKRGRYTLTAQYAGDTNFTKRCGS
jgi:hypothetical protein